MDKLLTEDKKKEYLKSKGMYCPHCESADLIDSSLADSPEFNLHQEVKCNNCKATFTNVYSLTNVYTN